MKGSRVLKMTKCCWYRVTCSDSEHSWRNYLNERKTQHHTTSAMTGATQFGVGWRLFRHMSANCGCGAGWSLGKLASHRTPLSLFFVCMNTVVMFEWDWSVIFKRRHCMRVALRFMIYWELWVMSYEQHGKRFICSRSVFNLPTTYKIQKIENIQANKKTMLSKLWAKVIIKNIKIKLLKVSQYFWFSWNVFLRSHFV